VIISPCGWYCLEEPAEWKAIESTAGLLLQRTSPWAEIEITSARSQEMVHDEEIIDLQEDYARKSPLKHQNTSLQTLPSGTQCLHSILASETSLECPVYVYWSNYCISLVARCAIDEYTEDIFRDIKAILNSIQPMTTD